MADDKFDPEEKLLEQIFKVFGRRQESGEPPLESLSPSERLIPDAPLNTEERNAVFGADCRWLGIKDAPSDHPIYKRGRSISFVPQPDRRKNAQAQTGNEAHRREPIQASGVEPSRASDEDDIREAVFRYLFFNNRAGARASETLFFLSVEGGRDPSDEFMARFQGATGIKKVSQALRSTLEGVRDRETNESGVILRVDQITWLSEDEVDVDGGHYQGGLNSSGNIYRVRREEGKWTVSSEGNLWIS